MTGWQANAAQVIQTLHGTHNAHHERLLTVDDAACAIIGVVGFDGLTQICHAQPRCRHARGIGDHFKTLYFAT